MASSTILFSFFLGLSLHVSATNPNDICPIRFAVLTDLRSTSLPSKRFHLEQCGYMCFDLLCNIRGQAILRLPDSQDFVINLINYKKQYVVLKDPGKCLTERLRNSTFLSSIFAAQEHRNFMFADCSGEGRGKWIRSAQRFAPEKRGGANGSSSHVVVSMYLSSWDPTT